MKGRETIGVAGLGLIGASVAKALKAFTPHRVLGADLSEKTMEKALRQGAVDAILEESSLALCDVLLLALYPEAAVEYLQKNAPFLPAGALVIDLCGVKRAVEGPLSALARENGFFYIGGHPMAGTEHSGYSFSDKKLFCGASMLLTPGACVPPAEVQKAKALFLELGFRKVVCTNAAEHDRVIAYTSQLAHLVSSAYVKSPSALSYAGFSAGSFRDMTRVAWLNEEMWTELFLANRDYLAAEAEDFCERLAKYAAALRAGNEKALFCLLREGRLRKELLMEGEKDGSC